MASRLMRTVAPRSQLRRFSSSSSPTCYLNGSYLPQAQARVPVDDRGFLFADGVYEVMKSYAGYVFTERQHLARLARGLQELRIADSASSAASLCEEVKAAGRELLKRNGLAAGAGPSSSSSTPDATIYIQITRGSAPRAHAFPSPPVRQTVYVFAKPFANPPARTFDEGVAVVTTEDTRWSRCDIKSISLLPNILANQKAKEKGAYECLLIRGGKNIVEASHSNVFAVVGDGTLVTPPLDNILPGITRDVILSRAKELGIRTKEAHIPVASFSTLRELFVTATTTEAMPVVEVEGLGKVGNGKVGEITRKLREAWPRWVEEERRQAM